MPTKIILSVDLANGARVFIPHVTAVSKVMEAENEKTKEKGFLYQIHLAGGLMYNMAGASKEATIKSRNQFCAVVDLYWRSQGYTEPENSNGIIIQK